jgi:hypothetical protein
LKGVANFCGVLMITRMTGAEKGKKMMRDGGKKTKKNPLPGNPVRDLQKKIGGDLLSHTVSRAVPSALKSLTSVFGMGTGGSSSL